MSDDEVAELLRSEVSLVVIEAPAGCGKTYQGASYARDAVKTLPRGRLLILAHTHAACGVFAERTLRAGSKVEIKTVASLSVEIAGAYHKALGIAAKPETWAWKNGGAGFDQIAQKCAQLLTQLPMIARALARRYPIIVCDEYQDCTADQHTILMALNGGGAKLRIFADPLQRIYTGRTTNTAKEDADCWQALRQWQLAANLSVRTDGWRVPLNLANGFLKLGRIC